MPNANFITQFEYRLNNLTGSETQSELLALRATADKYVDDLDSASVALLDAAIEVYADTLTSSSTIKELVTVGNADAEINGGSVYIIGESRSLYIDDPTGMIDIDGETWLRHGVIDDDIASYPDAKVGGGGVNGAAYTDFNFSVATQDNYPTGICWDGTHFWVVGATNDTVYQYLPDGTYTGFNFSITTQDTNPQGICWDGSHLWVVGNTNDTVYQYLPDGTYTGFNFSTAPQALTPRGICWDGSHLWVVGNTNDTVYQYLPDGTYTGVSFSVAAQDTNPQGVCWDGTHFWVVGSANDTVYQYTSAGTYTGVSFSVATQDNYPTGICWDGTHFWVLDDQFDSAYQYLQTYEIEYVGTPYADTDVSTGSPMYMRIK